MRADILQRRKTEIEAISGYLLEQKKNLPYTSLFINSVLALEKEGKFRMNIELDVSLPMILLSIPIFTPLSSIILVKKFFNIVGKQFILSVELTAIFYIVAVAIFDITFSYQFIGWILIVLIVILILHFNFSVEKAYGSRVEKRIKSSCSHIVFLLFGLLYILFLLYELVYFVYIHLFRLKQITCNYTFFHSTI